MATSNSRLVEAIRRAAHPLHGAVSDFQPLLQMIGDAHLVLLGEATHGTHEFYAARAEITQRLIERHGFTAICVEADWPDAYRVNRYVRGAGGGGGGDETAVEALGDFKRFPTWMWRNADVVELISWMREHNESLPPQDRVGFYGMDMYSLHSSMGAVVRYLEKVDPEAATRARERYACFDQFGREPQSYGYVASLGLSPGCESEVVKQLTDLRRHATDYLSRDGMVAEDELFNAEQNARLARSAERYYREMYHGSVQSWNLRDQHMVETLEALQKHQRRQRGESRIVVWAHNSHLGDARATSMGDHGEWNVGQLVRERHRSDAVLVGFTTCEGTVSAASDWGGAVERKKVRAARPDSYEGLFHETGQGAFMLNLRDSVELTDLLRERRRERAIGVIYRPESELASHYFHASLPQQFDAVLHYDHTRALEPLERTPQWTRGEEETFPTGL